MFTKYLELGLSLIPLVPRGKNPLIESWSEFSSRLPSLEEAERWDHLPSKNFGMVCGPASNLIGLDIDTDEKFILDNCPKSPLVKRGKKGETRFFQYNPEISSQRLGGKQSGIDILSTGRQTVIPPSIHPETKKPYVWLTKDTFENFEFKDLPYLSLNDLERMRALFTDKTDTAPHSSGLSGIFENKDPERESPTGSQDRLKTLASALVHQGFTLDQAVEELLKYDEQHHKPTGYFKELGRHSDGRADPYSNAARFYTSILRSVNEKKIRSGEAPSIPKPIKIEILGENLPTKPDASMKAIIKPYPETRGIMYSFQQACGLKSNAAQEALSLGGALSFVSVLAANRFASRIGMYTVTPNIFVLNLGYSSFGKEISQHLIDDLLAETNLIGAFNYRSGTSIVQDLPKQQERIDLIDEASSLLKAMTAKEIYQREMAEILSSLFSKAGSVFNGLSSAGKGARFGACWNPHISILASTTPEGFRESVSSGLQAKGLMPRFLTFFQKELGDFQYHGQESMKEIMGFERNLQDFVDWMTSQPKLLHPNFSSETNLLAKNQGSRNEDLTMGYRYAPTQIPFTEASEKFYIKFIRHYRGLCKKDPESFESAFYGRFGELACKVALLDSISIQSSCIELSSIEWACALVETQWENSRHFYEASSARTPIDEAIIRIRAIVKESGQISKSDLTRLTQRLDKRLRSDAIELLCETSQIERVEIKVTQNSPKSMTYFRFSDSLG